MEPRRILTIDDHVLFRKGLVMLIPEVLPDSEVEEAGSVDEAIDRLTRERFDAILLDLAMPGMDGFQGLRVFCENWPTIPVIVVTSSESYADVQRTFQEGARGYIPKSMSTRALRHALSLVLEGEMYIPSLAVSAIVSGSAAESAGAPASLAPSSLTPRQREVLKRMAKGLSNKQIARDLGMLEGTVKVHVKTILQKLKARNRTEAVITSIRDGVIASDGAA